MLKKIIAALALVTIFNVACARDKSVAEPWLSQIGGKGAEVVSGVTETTDGNICATGTFWSSAQFGDNNDSTLLHTEAAQDLFVACYRARGALTFARRFGAQRGDEPRAIAALPGGDVVVAGLFAHTLGIEKRAALRSDGNANIFVMRLDANGNIVWARQFGGRLADSGNALAVTPEGDILLAGNFSGLMTYQVGDKTAKLQVVGNRDAVAMKLSSGGEVLWARRAGGAGFDEATAIAAGSNGSVLVAGTFRGTAVIGNTTLTSHGYKDVFLLALDAHGAPLWTQHIGGPGQDDVGGLAWDGRGHVHLAGNFQQTIAVPGSDAIVSAGSTDVFIARYDDNGALQRLSSFGGALTDQVFGLAATSNSGLLLSGHYQGDTDVAPGADVVRLTAPSPGNSSGFVVALNLAGNHVWSNTIGGSGMEMVLDVAALSDGGAALVGVFNADLGIGDAEPLNSRGKTDVFVARLSAPQLSRPASGGIGDVTQFDW